MNKSTDKKNVVSVYEFIVHRKRVTANEDIIRNGVQVARFCHETIYDEDEMWREKAVAIYLSKSNKVLGYEVLSVGGPNTCSFEPKMICRTAVQMMADSVVAVHNHPSGSPLPSQQDIEQMSKLRKALACLDIKLLDAVIITESNRFYSFESEVESKY